MHHQYPGYSPPHGYPQQSPRPGQGPYPPYGNNAYQQPGYPYNRFPNPQVPQGQGVPGQQMGSSPYPNGYQANFRLNLVAVQGPPRPTQYASKPQQQAQYGTKPQTPAQYASKPQQQAQYGTKPQTPAQYGTKPQTPAQYGAKPQTPTQYGTKPQTPAQYESKPQTPAQYGTKPQKPQKQTNPAPGPKTPTAAEQQKISYPKVHDLEYYEEVYHSKPDSFWEKSKLKYNPWAVQSWHPIASPGSGAYPTIDIHIDPVFSLAEFQELRHHATEASALRQLWEIATEVSPVSRDQLPRVIKRACFICTNSYTTASRSLGVGPINDSIVVAANHAAMGYKVFFIFNPTCDHYKACLKHFLKSTTDYLTVYYSGHGTKRVNMTGTEVSGYDQLLVFDDGYIIDDDLADMLCKYSKGIAKTLLLNDCCHSGTIWDIPTDPIGAMKFPANIVSFSATNDNETAKQTSIDRNSQGLFTYFFWKNVRENPGITLEQLKPKIDRSVSKYNQHCKMIATRPNILTQPFFPAK